MTDLLRKKIIVLGDDQPEHHRLARTLSWPHLIALGVGAIVGTGILTLIGVGAGLAGRPSSCHSQSRAESAPVRRWLTPKWRR